LEPNIVRANVNRILVAAPTFVSLYANDTQVQVTPWDFRLILGEISDIGPKGDPSVTIKLVGEVRMSPQHVKKLVQVISGQLALYEKNFGPIPQPPD
jgi:hypothetical protein